jgi:hypothetical protein
VGKTLPLQPVWSSPWAGLLEAGDTKFFIGRGYVHVIGVPRGVGCGATTDRRSCVGACERLIEISAEHAKTRKQFGKAIGEFQAVQFMLAEMATHWAPRRSTVTLRAF